MNAKNEEIVFLLINASPCNSVYTSTAKSATSRKSLTSGATIALDIQSHHDHLIIKSDTSGDTNPLKLNLERTAYRIHHS